METKKALTIGVAVATIAGAAIAFLQWRFPVSPEEKAGLISPITINNQPIVQVGMQSAEERQPASIDASHQIVSDDARLVVSGAGVQLHILRSKKGYPYMGGAISNGGGEKTIFLPENQRLQLSISGAGTKVFIEESVFENVSVTDTGAGTEIHRM